MAKPWPKALLLGIGSSLFFSVTYVINNAIAQSGGDWLWSASLRYLFMLPILLVTAVSYGVAELFGAVSINDRVLDSRMEQVRKGRKRTTAETTVTVQPDSFAEGKEIRDILWPDGLFVLAVDKSRALGGKTLHAGDRLQVRYSTFHEERLHQDLAAIVGAQQEESLQQDWSATAGAQSE